MPPGSIPGLPETRLLVSEEVGKSAAREKEGEAGDSVKEVCRRHGVSPATYYQWKSKYGGLQPSDLKRMKELEESLGFRRNDAMPDAEAIAVPTI